MTQAVLASIHLQAKLAKDVERQLDRQESGCRRTENAMQKRQRHVQMKLAQLTEQKKDVYLRYDKGELSWAEFDAECKALGREIDNCQKELSDSAKSSDSVWATHTLCHRGQISDLKELEQIKTLDRETVDRLIHSVKVYIGNRIEIIWNFNTDGLLN